MNSDGPCSNYCLDTVAPRFGQCVCGYPKQAHAVKDENKAAVALKALSAKASSSMSGMQSKPCSDFKADTKSEEFGMCICGHLKHAHVVKEVNPAAAARARLDTKAVTAAQVNACEPCSDFRADIRSVSFGMCLCGHSQSAHKEKTINPAQAAKQAMAWKSAAREATRKAAAQVAYKEKTVNPAQVAKEAMEAKSAEREAARKAAAEASRRHAMAAQYEKTALPAHAAKEANEAKSAETDATRRAAAEASHSNALGANHEETANPAHAAEEAMEAKSAEKEAARQAAAKCAGPVETAEMVTDSRDQSINSQEDGIEDDRSMSKQRYEVEVENNFGEGSQEADEKTNSKDRTRDASAANEVAGKAIEEAEEIAKNVTQCEEAHEEIVTSPLRDGADLLSNRCRDGATPFVSWHILFILCLLLLSLLIFASSQAPAPSTTAKFSQNRCLSTQNSTVICPFV